MVGCGDAVGTVREAAFRSLSDIILIACSISSSSLLSTEEVAFSAADFFQESSALFQCIAKGLLDSKLTTRLNAVDTLSSYLLVRSPLT